MAKFGLDDRFTTLWKNEKFLRTFIDQQQMLRTNHGFYRTQMTIDPSLTPRNSQGIASYTVQSVIRKAKPMANIRSPFGGSKALDREGMTAYSGTIPDLTAYSIHETAFERQDKEERFAQFGDRQLIIEWTDKVQEQIDEMDQALSNMTAQIISKAKIDYNYGIGDSFYADAMLPVENIMKAGIKPDSKAWSDAECPLLDQMAELEDKLRTDYGIENMAMKWQIPYKMFRDVFLKNKQVRQLVKDYRTNNQQATTAGFVITEATFKEVVTAAYPEISPIEVIVEKQKDIYSGDVHGWNANSAVFRPAGYAGELKRSAILEEKMKKYTASDISKVFSPVGTSGLYTLVNTIVNDGEWKGFHTDLYGAIVPTLNEVPFHFIIDTSKAGNGITTIE